MKVKRTIHKTYNGYHSIILRRIRGIKLGQLVSGANRKMLQEKTEPKTLPVHVNTYGTTSWGLTHLTTLIPEA